jgi:hypothetical protein
MIGATYCAQATQSTTDLQRLRVQASVVPARTDLHQRARLQHQVHDWPALVTLGAGRVVLHVAARLADRRGVVAVVRWARQAAINFSLMVGGVP